MRSSGNSQTKVDALRRFLLEETGPNGCLRFSERGEIVKLLASKTMSAVSAETATSKLINQGRASRPVWEALESAVGDIAGPKHKHAEVSKLKELLADINRSQPERQPDETLKDFEESCESAREYFAVRRLGQPSCILSSPRLREFVMRKLGLAKGRDNGETGLHYTLLLSSQDAAEKARQELFKAACGLNFEFSDALPPERAMERLRTLMISNQLRLASIHADYCHWPISAHDPSDPEHARGFFDFYEGDRMNPVNIPKPYFRAWLDEVYERLTELKDYRPVAWNGEMEDRLVSEAYRRLAIRQEVVK